MLAPLFLAALAAAAQAQAEPTRLQGDGFVVQVDSRDGRWSLLDPASGVRWPSEGQANGKGLKLSLVDGNRSVEIRPADGSAGELRILGDALALGDREQAAVIVPSREGLFIPADSKVAFKSTFGASEYEGCHMNMVGFLKRGSALLATWDGVSVFPEIQSELKAGDAHGQEIRTTFSLRKGAKAIRLTPLGKGDWNTLAAAYRKIAEAKGLAVTMAEKARRDPHAELLLGASNVKLWFCLMRQMSEDSTKVEKQAVNWTFEETARVAEHLRHDLEIDRCLFTIGGWTEGGYDVRHPDALPANPECGGDAALADAVARIQKLGYVASLHDNYQDMYKDAKSWNPDLLQKRPDGSVDAGGRWNGGRAYMVCATNQVALAARPQNLPEIRRRFGPWSYFIDTTYAVGPQQCFDPKHPLDRDGDVAWKSKLSDAARATFGLFGSECGREWAIPHSDFFEGLTGVAGKDFHNLDPRTLGATVIPFWEMVYHDCEACYGKYGYDAARAGAYVARHVLDARPLNYHSMPDHLYWETTSARHESVHPKDALASYTRSDRGWAEGLHPIDVFLKNTHEILGPLNRVTGHQRLTRLEFLNSTRTLCKATYGEGGEATVVVANLGGEEARITSELGGPVVLPAYGFTIDGPQFAGFLATHWGGRDYPGGALFTIRSEGGSLRVKPGKVRIFHGFGDPRIDWKGKTHEVTREAVVGEDR
ncbi:DUF6259 domain-containing protein [Aquisphaera insulae]|uniref:DUF6259 domain-containing protein n=1 Tax=Aquisphaera insulae TaxID=2712864 RepID=UPI0013EAFD0D|nr:DUF6259 domain-containing protein [Aquisphaera insulae]